MKKVLLFLLLLVSAFTVTGCGKDKDGDSESKYVVKPNEWVKAYDLILQEELDGVTPTYAVIKVSYTTEEGDSIEGEIKVRLFMSLAPKTCENFINLVENEFYDGLTFHRVIDNFMIQGGDPTQDDEDAKEADKIKGEFANNDFYNNLKHTTGVISMARVSGDNDSANSQFFICENSDGCESLNGDYAGFGVVVDGMEYVHAIADLETDNSDKPVDTVTIVSIRMVK